jgi:PAS domain S-box-containing protein
MNENAEQNPWLNSILVVEDDPSLSPLIQSVLRTHGFQALCATSAVEALRLWAETDRATPVALIDLGLPGEMSGEALARQLKAEKSSLKVIITSGCPLWPESSIPGLADVTFLQKPFLPADLVRVVRQSVSDAVTQPAVTQPGRGEDSEQWWRVLFEDAPDAYFLNDFEGNLLACNRAAEELSGYRKEQLIGNSFLALRLLDPDGLSRAAANLAKNAQGLATGPEEFTLTRQDARRVIVEIRAHPIKIGNQALVLGAARDVTARKRSEEAVRHSEERFRRMAENIECVFWMANPELTQMLYVSPAYEQIWGRTCASLYERPGSFLDSVRAEDRERLQAVLRQENQQEFEIEYRVLRPDGSMRWVRDRGFPVKGPAGRIESVVGIAEDITERKQLEAQLRHAQRMEAIGQLAGGVAHDFNNLLGIIRGNAELLLMEAGPEAAASNESLTQITAATERAANLTRQLLAFSRKQDMQFQSLLLNDLIANLTKMLKRIIGENIDLQCHLAPELPCVRADAGMIEQVLVNLVVNARDAMPRGGQLRITTEQVSLHEADRHSIPESRAGDFVCLTVKDTGTGIAPEHLPRVFEPFFTTKEPGKGTGLGLSTAYGIVKQHEGWITVSSRVGKGTMLRIFLPAILAPADANPAPAADLLRGGTEGILLVEDDYSVRMITRRILETFGYEVFESASASGALKIWDENAGRISLLLTDLVMAEKMTGLELAERLRAQAPALKVIFLSGYSSDVLGKDRESLQKPYGNFLRKPCSTRTLLEAVRGCLDGLEPPGASLQTGTRKC